MSVKVWFDPPDDTLLEETRKLQLASVGVRRADVERRLAASAAKASKSAVPRSRRPSCGRSLAS